MHFKTQTDRCDNKLMLHWLAGDWWIPTESKRNLLCDDSKREKPAEKF